MFPSTLTVDQLNGLCRNTLVSHIGILFTEINEDSLVATLPVNKNTVQPAGILHGGASVVLAETLGSVAANCLIDQSKQYCVGLEINANHVKSANSGVVKGITKPVHLGKKTHIWEIRILNEENKLVCISRITMAILDKK